MPLGDILVITDDHKKAAREITDLVLENYAGEKISIGIGAESGSGKSEISHVVASSLFKSNKKLKSFTVHTDDFFALPHKERNELRVNTNSSRRPLGAWRAIEFCCLLVGWETRLFNLQGILGIR